MFLALSTDIQLHFKKKDHKLFLDPSANVNYVNTHFNDFQFLATQIFIKYFL